MKQEATEVPHAWHGLNPRGARQCGLVICSVLSLRVLAVIFRR
ncbi:hypothetical protein [Actinomadura madurae]|nr:hypothetical protein [Actinomadura madurae]